MIIAVSMNPSIDRIINVQELKTGKLNRALASSVSAGGKGINIANNISIFTNDILLTGFVGNKNCEVIDDCVKKLQDQGIEIDFVEIDGSNRTNIKIIEESGRLTEVNEPGFQVTEKEIELLKNKLFDRAIPGNIFILTGSVPKGVDKSIYANLTKELKLKGAQVYVDSDGEALKAAVECVPNVIKPNEYEILDLFSEKNVSEKLLISRARELVDKGIETVIVSRGSRGSLFVNKDAVYQCDAISVDVKSTVGAGDAMLSAFTYAMSNNKSFEECIRLSVAAASIAVTNNKSYLSDEGVIYDMAKLVNLNNV